MEKLSSIALQGLVYALGCSSHTKTAEAYDAALSTVLGYLKARNIPQGNIIVGKAPESVYRRLKQIDDSYESDNYILDHNDMVHLLKERVIGDRIKPEYVVDNLRSVMNDTNPIVCETCRDLEDDYSKEVIVNDIPGKKVNFSVVHPDNETKAVRFKTIFREKKNKWQRKLHPSDEDLRKLWEAKNKV